MNPTPEERAAHAERTGGISRTAIVKHGSGCNYIRCGDPCSCSLEQRRNATIAAIAAEIRAAVNAALEEAAQKIEYEYLSVDGGDPARWTDRFYMNAAATVRALKSNPEG